MFCPPDQIFLATDSLLHCVNQPVYSQAAMHYWDKIILFFVVFKEEKSSKARARIKYITKEPTTPEVKKFLTNIPNITP